MKKKASLAIVLITGFLSGFIAGIAIMTSLFAHRIDNYLARIGVLENTLADRENRLKKLEESLNAKSKEKYILKNIEVYLAYNGNELDKIEIEKHIEEKYRYLIGREVSDIDIELAAEVVDKRVFFTDSSMYRLRVERLLLSEVMKIWVNIKPFEE
jgi:hypothetical protein